MEEVIGSIPLGSTKYPLAEPGSGVHVTVPCTPDAGMTTSGALAQLGERFHGMEEVIGSIPLGSTNFLTNDIAPATDRDRVDPSSLLGA